MMKLYFLRHADALGGMNDAVRPLSTDGVAQAKGVARYLKSLGVVPDGAYSSPLVRARDTAQLVLEGTDSRAKLQLVDALLNECLQHEFEDWLATLPDANHLLLVGHAPILARRVRSLTGMVNQLMDLPKAGMACVETSDRRSGELVFFVTPRDYR